MDDSPARNTRSRSQGHTSGKTPHHCSKSCVQESRTQETNNIDPDSRATHASRDSIQQGKVGVLRNQLEVGFVNKAGNLFGSVNPPLSPICFEDKDKWTKRYHNVGVDVEANVDSNGINYIDEFSDKNTMNVFDEVHCRLFYSPGKDKLKQQLL